MIVARGRRQVEVYEGTDEAWASTAITSGGRVERPLGAFELDALYDAALGSAELSAAA